MIALTLFVRLQKQLGDFSVGREYLLPQKTKADASHREETKELEPTH